MTSYGEDPADRLTSENNPIGGLLTWTYDTAGRRITSQTNAGIGTYAYDIADGLLSVTNPSGVTSYSQDANGNTTVVQGPTGSPISYIWDPANRMTKATLPAGQVHTNQYRHDNMRVKNVTPSGTEQFVWDGDGLPDLMFVVGSGGAAGHLAVRGKNLSRMVGTYGGGGSLREQFHLDRQESVIALTGLYGNNPSTDLRNKFNAFGEMYSSQLTGVNYAYVGGQGYWHDFDLGMDYVRNRWLENNLGRRLSRDPIGFAGGLRHEVA